MADTKNLVIGIVLLVLGVLMLIGRFGVEAMLPFLGVILIVVGILMLLRVLGGGALFGLIALVLGILLQVNWLPDPPRFARDLMDIANLVIGIVLVVMGALKVLGKR